MRASNLKRENSYKGYFKIQKPTSKYDFATTLHSNFMQNYIYTAPTGKVLLTTKGAFPEYTYQQTNALLSGVDIDFSYKWTNKFSSLTKSTYLYAYDFDENNGLIGISPNRIEQAFWYSIFKKNEDNDLIFSFAASYFFKQNNSNLNFELVNPPKGYYLFDTGLSYKIRYNYKYEYRHDYIKVNFEINNLLNTQYRDYMNRNRFFANEMGRNFKLSIEIPFTIINKEMN